MTGRTIRVDTLARVEGEGSLYIKMAGERVADVKLKIYEPPRFFEAFLRGRHYSEAPDITSRICGICPVAYQMSAIHAMERALGIRIDPAVRLLRRLFYCGEWIESHVLHVYMLHAPDFLGYQDVIAMASDHRSVVEKALRLKKIGNRIVSLLGGREIHPISAAVGGFYKTPTKYQLRELVEDLEWALQASLETVQWTAVLEFPDFEQDYEFVALRHPDEYPFNEGRLVSNRGLDIDAAEYEDHFIELHVKHSNALHSVMRGRGSYLVGPLARFNLNFEKLPQVAQEAAVKAHLQPPVKNPFRSIVVRAVEVVFACAEALRIIREYEPPVAPRTEAPNRAAVGQSITEAPRGILYHRYALDDRGLIVTAKIIPPTSQNQRRIEDDLREYAARLVAWPLEDATWKCEQAIRNYDPCISCATHFLKLEIERSDTDNSSGMRIIGCGNRERGDDGAGVLVAERLRELGVESAGVEAKTCRGEATELMDAWGADDHVIVVDAVVTGASAGTVHRWDGGVPRSGVGTSASTHGFGVGEAIQLARALGRSPKSLRVYGIEGRLFDRGSEISPEVKRAVENVAQQIRAEMRALHDR